MVIDDEDDIRSHARALAVRLETLDWLKRRFWHIDANFAKSALISFAAYPTWNLSEPSASVSKLSEKTNLVGATNLIAR